MKWIAAKYTERMEELKAVARGIFEEDASVLVVQIRKLSDYIQIKTSTAKTMSYDKPMHLAAVFFRFIHFR